MNENLIDIDNILEIIESAELYSRFKYYKVELITDEKPMKHLFLSFDELLDEIIEYFPEIEYIYAYFGKHGEDILNPSIYEEEIVYNKWDHI